MSNAKTLARTIEHIYMASESREDERLWDFDDREFAIMQFMADHLDNMLMRQNRKVKK